MARALVITPEIQKEIDAAIERARRNPIPIERLKEGAVKGAVITLADRKPGFERGTASEYVLIPMGYRAAISFEQQPPGLCRHLSISVDTPGRIPNRAAALMIAEAFGMHALSLRKQHGGRAWLEEFEPGHYAVNLVTLEDR